MGRTGIKIIPNKIFYQMWIEVQNVETVEDYVSALTSYQSDKRIQFDKYRINYSESYLLLKNIYEAHCLSFREILEKAGIKKSQASYEFCIPIRTIEDWYSGKNKCPSYIKLSIIRAYRLLDLGKYIYLQSEIEYLNRKKPIYNKSNRELSNQDNKNMSGEEIESRICQKKENESNKIRNKEAPIQKSYRFTDDGENDFEYDYRSLNEMYSNSASHISYAELQRRMNSYKESSQRNRTEYAYDDYLRRKREKDNK